MPTPYHLLTRDDPRHRAWQLPVAGVMAIGGFLMLLVGAQALHPTPGSASGVVSPVAQPLDLAVDLGVVALGGAALLGALWLTGSPALRLVWSVEGRVRWGWWGRCCALSFATVLLVLSLSSAMPDTPVGRELVVPSMAAWWGVVVGLLLVPLQATAQELAFRGYLPQLLALAVPVSWIGIAASTLFYVAAHGYGTWGLVEVGVLGLAAGVMTQRTGGLEAAVALHLAHGVVLLALEAFGVVSPALVVVDGSPQSALMTAVVAMAVVLLVEWQVGATGLATRRVIGHAPESEVVQSTPHETTGEPGLHPKTPDYPGDLGVGWDR